VGAICDVYGPNLERAFEAKGAKAYRSYQALLADKDIRLC
jgi:predicted dehydrogenase